MKKTYKFLAGMVVTALMVASCGGGQNKDFLSFKDRLLNQVNDTTYFIDYLYSNNSSFVDSVIQGNSNYIDTESFLASFDSSDVGKDFYSNAIEPIKSNIIENLTSYYWEEITEMNNRYWEKVVFSFEKDGTVKFEKQRIRDVFYGDWKTKAANIFKWELQNDDKKLIVFVSTPDNDYEFFITPNENNTDFYLRGKYTLTK